MPLVTCHYPSIETKRQELGTSKTRLCEVLNLSLESVSLKLEGKREFSVTELMTLSDFWRVSMDELVGHLVNDGAEKGVR